MQRPITLRSLALATLVLAGCVSPPAGAESPALADPARIAGAWRLEVAEAAPCRLELSARPSANGYQASASPGCTAAVRQWRPTPEGLEIAAEDGLTLMLFTPDGPGRYLGFDGQRRRASLSRL
ncbi:MAG TPA: AprI/Inh family metalloprotease inhibitor [Phenylobacterium sp.]